MTKELEAAMLKVETFLDRTKLVSSSPTDGEIAAIEMLVTALATPAEPVLCKHSGWSRQYPHRGCDLPSGHGGEHKFQPVTLAAELANMRAAVRMKVDGSVLIASFADRIEASLSLAGLPRCDEDSDDGEHAYECVTCGDRIVVGVNMLLRKFPAAQATGGESDD